jgi:DNA repair photolyase
MVKEDAPALLRRELASSRWRPRALALSGVTDPYQPVERRLELTRRCLAVLVEFRNPVMVATKNYLVTRDLDLLGELSRHGAAAVSLSITSLDQELVGRLEPRASAPARRLAAITALAKASIPVGVLVSPVIPGLTDHEIPAILAAAAQAGAQWAGMTMVRLPHAVASLFEQWLENHAPEKKEKVLNRIRAVRGGALNDSRFGYRMRGEGLFAEQIARLFSVGRRQAGLADAGPGLSTKAFRRAAGAQMELEL